MTDDEPEAARRAEFDAFYLSTSRRLVGVIYTLTGDLADAEDAVQEAYARAWPRWSVLVERGDPTGWVRVVAQRIAIGTWRRTRNRLTAHFRHGVAEPVSGVSADHVALVTALRQLPGPQRNAIVLFHLCDLPGTRVAEELGITEVALRARLNRARKELRRHLNDTHPEARIGADANR